MKTRTIKGVDEETWKLLKETASRKRLKMGILLKEIATAYRKRPSDTWNQILYAKPVITKKEAKTMLKMVDELRKQSGYRNVTIN